jgi:VWFA-related protein
MRPHAIRPTGSAIWAAAAVLVLAAAVVSPRASSPQQPQAPVFRSTVDLIAVQVQVVDESGTPVEALGPEDFEVSISGNRRRVISADHVRSTTLDGRPFEASSVPGLVATNLWPVDPRTAADRTYVMAFDVGSLSLADSRAVVGSALTFIDRLLPTTNHEAVKQLVGTVVGSPQGYSSQFNLSPSEIIDINAESARLATVRMGQGLGRGRGRGQEDIIVLAGAETMALRSVERRECDPTELGCVEEIQSEARALAYFLEGEARVSLNGLRDLISSLADYPGRKTLVMFSSGITESDRPGGRPDLGNLPRILGQDAAATNTTIYTLHIDTAEVTAMAAERRRPSGSPGRRTRDFAVGSKALEEFTAASGGALLRVVTGSGEYALDRVLRETSSHYLLGVEPEEDDRDGELQSLRVRVNVDDVTVRSRTWVVVPRPAGES